MAYSNRALSIVSVIIVLGVAGGGIWWRLKPETESDGNGPDGEVAEEVAAVTSASQQFSTDVPQPVVGAEVIFDTLWVTVTAAGEAAAYAEAPITAQVEGMITGLPVRENQAVAAGRSLVQIDTTEHALAVARAQMEVENKTADFQRLVLLDNEIQDAELRAERERLARSRSGLNQAQVDLRTAQINLERTNVTAPFGGRVADLQVVRGQYVTAGTELLTLVDLDPIKVEVQVLEAELGFLQEGRGVSVTFAAFPGQVFRGRIETINPKVDPDNRTGRVTVHLPNPDGRIKPGMYARVTIEAQALPDRTLLPRNALLERDGRYMVFVYEPDGRDGRAQWEYVTIGQENEQWVELTRGDEGWVDAGQTVLIDGHHYLAHDAKVRLTDDVGEAGGRPSR